MKAKQKNRSLFVILAVSALTLYNILPTIFFYSNPLKAPVDEKKGTQIAHDIADRVNKLEPQSIEWINSFCNLLKVKPTKIKLNKANPELISVSFETEKEAKVFRSHMARAGNLIPFFPKRMHPYSEKASQSEDRDFKTVDLKREIPVHFNSENIEKTFTFIAMQGEDGKISNEYRDILDERVNSIIKSATHENEVAASIERAMSDIPQSSKTPYFVGVAEKLLSYKKLFNSDNALQKRFLSSLFASPYISSETLYNECIKGFQASRDALLKDKVTLKDQMKKDNVDESDSSAIEVGRLKMIEHNEAILLDGLTFLKKNQWLSKSYSEKMPETKALLTNQKIQKAENFTLSTGSQNPVISAFDVDYTEKKVTVKIDEALTAFLEKAPATDKAKIEAIIYDQIAQITNSAKESVTRAKGAFVIDLKGLNGAKSALKLELSEVAKQRLASIEKSLNSEWVRDSDTLSEENYKIAGYEAFKASSEQDQRFTLTLFSPLLEKDFDERGFRNGSLYIVAKDLLKIYKNLSAQPYSEENSNAYNDIMSLEELLRGYGARTYAGGNYPFSSAYKDDIIYEIPDLSGALLSATRENFNVIGSEKFALLEFSDVRNRILTVNKIEDEEHADLLKWSDDYQRAMSNPDSEGYMSVPKPTQSAFWSNIKLSASKYFRGDERKILHWGQDLDGGSSVSVALKDKKNKQVKDEADINQGISELYRRVNKMGVSDVSIRREGSLITLDFPTTQSMSAAELVTASSMTFHIVNEKFSMHNDQIRTSVARFLQEVWNEALATNKTDLESVNKIAFNHLYGDSVDQAEALPRTESGRVLLDNGLVLANPESGEISSEFNDKISKIAMLEGDSYQDWYGSANPLVIILNNYALEGSSLSSINAGYDPSSGNFLSFSVNSSGTNELGEKIDPREVLYSWTSVFSTSQMHNIDYSQYTNGNGWRLAAILNGKIVSMPRLSDSLKDNGRITGSFTQKEVSKLAADLKAGSLTYTPEIVSETTISPELGAKERAQGLMATFIAFVAVILIMVGYYRFAGIIASIAVVFNLLIIWATLQNIGASLTLAGIAGVILTIGMAVDANVLIFERIREENEVQDNLTKSISAGYKKAFTAIFDSNITTIIAALILLNFDAGPVKGFAMTLIIGIASSMFTALYMTRTFFSFWRKEGKEQKLTMMNLIPDTGLSFMKFGKLATIVSAVIIMIGAVTLYEQRKTLFGMDFTGGMTLELETASLPQGSAKTAVEHAFLAGGLKASEFSIRELGSDQKLKIYLSNALTNPGRPFADLKKPVTFADVDYSYEKNPKLAYIVSLLKKENVQLSEKTLVDLDKNFSSISGQMSDTMRNNAIIGLTLALAAILIYITVRFEFTYAISATIGLAFDLMLTLAFLGIFKAFGFPLTIDLNTIAALMTIIGYSLNDTIIVFDRVRSDLKVKKTTDLKSLIDNSLNKTLSRTIMTSLTTLVVLLSLVLLGGRSIFNFSFLMMLGVIIGTGSTLFLASTFLAFFKGQESGSKKKAHIVSING